MLSFRTGARIRVPLFVAALLLAIVAVNAVPTASGARPYLNDIRLAVWNNSNKPIKFDFCLNGHVSTAYQLGRTSNPCSVVPYTKTLYPGEKVEQYDGNPLGVIMYLHGSVAYFYLSNPALARPFFEVNGNKIPMVEGELQKRHPLGTTTMLHRRGDSGGYKIMIIEITKA